MDSSILSDLTYEETKLQIPPLSDIVKALSEGLKKNFAQVEVNEVECPDLRQPPFNLAAQGICGNEIVAQVGDVSYLLPDFKNDKIYDYNIISKIVDVNPTFIIGAGAGKPCDLPSTGEIFMNIFISNDKILNLSKKIFTKDRTCDGLTAKADDVTNSKFSGLGNIFINNGETGPVIRIICKGRISEKHFHESIVYVLRQKFKQILAFGMVFQMVRGKAKHHVVKTFAKGVKTSKEIHDLFLFPEVEAPFISVGTILTSNPPDCNVAPFHFHSYKDKGEGGHYLYDTTPDEAEYLAYIKPANKFLLMDRSPEQMVLTNFNLD